MPTNGQRTAKASKMENTRLLLASMVRLKGLRLNSDLDKDFQDYSYKFNKIMTVLDDNELSIPRRLEDVLFDSGLPEGSKVIKSSVSFEV